MFGNVRILLSIPAEVTSSLKILALSPGATLNDVREAYLKLARSHHPDIQGGDDSKMKIINIAYETLQLHGTGASNEHASEKAPSEPARPWYDRGADQKRSSFKQKGKTMAALVDDEFDTWNAKSTFDWVSAVSDVSASDAALPFNNPQSHSRFFSYDEDVAIYRMLRSGATIPQISRALQKTATFVGKRVHHPQFKLRIQQVLKKEKAGKTTAADPLSNKGAGVTVRQGSNQVHGRPLTASEQWERNDATRNNNIKGWTASHITSSIGKNYSNFNRFNRPT
eukprot:Tbor_TRINITY_DN916_c0_g1::TRINITY_DN916_c0_g1_i1::g.21141::m.21141